MTEDRHQRIRPTQPEASSPPPSPPSRRRLILLLSLLAASLLLGVPVFLTQLRGIKKGGRARLDRLPDR